MRKKQSSFTKISVGKYLLPAAASVAVGQVYAQEAVPSPARPGLSSLTEEIVVVGQPVYRDRTSAISPELQYGLNFFQQFEPVSVGDMLKRTPGISFTSDIGEYDAPQMRGLGAGYTQILVNGRRVPGSGADRAVFVDRIPAEMVERIEIIRSPSADQDSQGVGGTINIILKDGASLEGGNFRLGALYIDGDELRGSTALNFGGQSNDVSWAVSASVQERYVPKVKIEQKFDPDDLELTDWELENDTRDSDDTSLSANVRFELGRSSSLELSANYVSTQRSEVQTEDVFEVDAGVFTLDELTFEDLDIDENSLTFGAIYQIEIGNDTIWDFSASVSELDDDEEELVFERGDAADPWDHVESEILGVSDSEVLLGTKIVHTTGAAEIITGLDASVKERDETLTAIDIEDMTSATQNYEAEEERVDGYLVGSMNFGDLDLELGVRVEHTKRTIENAILSQDISSTEVNPSAHLSYAINDSYTTRMSIARTVRRPGFDQLTPTIQLDEPEDGDAFQGNPGLEDEISWGLDIGIERTLAKRGIVGLNAFYRDVTDVIEEVGVGVAPGGGILFSFDNTGDGTVWGLELDVSVPIGPDTGFFANATLLDSEIEDPFTGEERRFRDQSDYIYNVGLTHNIPSWKSTLGVSYQKQGDSLSVDIDREVDLEYEGNLELFVEKRFGMNEDYVMRLTGNNLLDAHKLEHFTNYDGDDASEILTNHINNDIDEFEEEDEQAGPVWTLTFRKMF